MSAGVIIAIVVGVIVLAALLLLLGKKGRERRLETRREQAHEIRHEAQVHGAQAERERAEADERAARARREQAVAQEQAARADKSGRFARERHEEAVRVDPDADEGDDEERRGGLRERLRGERREEQGRGSDKDPDDYGRGRRDERAEQRGGAEDRTRR
jgi:hypothetical protein